jgi:hypothetical protein
VVEKPRDVKKKGNAYVSVSYRLFGFVREAERHVGGQVVMLGPELAITNKRCVVYLPCKACSHHFLKCFPIAFQEGNWAVCFHDHVITLARFGDDYNGGVAPRMMA